MSGCVLHHELAGPAGAPPLVMCGSLGTNLEMWEPQVAPLSAHLRLVRLDVRGHGRSPVPQGPYTIEELGRDVLVTMDRLGIAQASYCGLSIGGMVGMWLAAWAPERVDRLILLCTSAHLPPISQWTERAALVRESGTPEVMAERSLGRWFTPAWAAAHADAVVRHRAMIADTPAEGYASCCEAIGGLDLRGDLGRITAPTLVLAGAEDPATPPEHGRAIANAIPGARFEVLAQSAHLASVEQAQTVNRLIGNHLDLEE